MGSQRVRHDWATFTFSFTWVSLVAKMVKHLPAMQDTQVQSLGWEDPLEKEMATHSSILAWKIPWSEKPDKLQSMGSQRVQHDSQKWLHFCMLFIYVWMSVITYYGKCQKENMYLLLLYKAYIRASLVAQIVKYILFLKLKNFIGVWLIYNVVLVSGVQQSELVLPTHVCMLSRVRLWDLMDYSPPGSSVHGILQARILKHDAISYSRGSSQPRDWICVSCIPCIGRWILYHCTTLETLYIYIYPLFRRCFPI